jgi:acetyl-CoA C-acetyltransferase
MAQPDVFIVAAKRTPIGAFMGALSGVSAIELGATALKAAIAQSGVPAEAIQEFYMGNVISANLGQAPATQVALAAGLAPTTPCTMLNKACASGSKAIMLAASSIRLGENEIVAAGGTESMSGAPFLLPNHRAGHKYGNHEILDAVVRDGLQDPFKFHMMGMAAEFAAEKYKFTRESQDAFAVESYRKAERAWKGGKFAAEIAPVTIAGKKGDVVFAEDEEPGRVLYDKIPTLKPAFKKDGTVTAANASKLNDGASAVILASEAAVKKYNLKPIARIVAYGDASREPDWFTIAPADALPVALKRAGLALNDIDLVEINEAFSVVGQVNAQLLDLPMDKLNIYGGAVALGHPVGSSGARIAVTMCSELQQENKRYGAIAICNGGGGASAIVLERV